MQKQRKTVSRRCFRCAYHTTIKVCVCVCVCLHLDLFIFSFCFCSFAFFSLQRIHACCTGFADKNLNKEKHHTMRALHRTVHKLHTIRILLLNFFIEHSVSNFCLRLSSLIHFLRCTRRYCSPFFCIVFSFGSFAKRSPIAKTMVEFKVPCICFQFA